MACRITFQLCFLLTVIAATVEFSNALLPVGLSRRWVFRPLTTGSLGIVPSPVNKNNDIQNDSSSLSSEDVGTTSNREVGLTSMLLRVSFDGGRFSGWSSGNDSVHVHNAKPNNTTTSNIPAEQQQQEQQQGVSRRQRRRGVLPDVPKGFVRSVEGVLQKYLAKLYGNVNPERIIIEGSSRTDKGVHAKGMICCCYCLTVDAFETLQSASDDMDFDIPSAATDASASNDCIGILKQRETGTTTTTSDKRSIHYSIPGKRKPHPISPTDASYFEPVPKDGDLSRIGFSLNRMLPADVRVAGIAPTPNMLAPRKGESTVEVPLDQSDLGSLPFHPSLHAVGKTYEYLISVGAIHDPTLWRLFWHISNIAPENGELHVKAMEEACRLLEGNHNFAAFQGAPRGASDKHRRQRRQQKKELPGQATVCTLSHVSIRQLPAPLQEMSTAFTHHSSKLNPPVNHSTYFPGLDPPLRTYVIRVTGNRFLYKMMRFLVGALVAVGTGRLELQDIEHALQHGSWQATSGTDEQDTDAKGGEESTGANHGTTKNSTMIRKEFQCAPPHGLSLQHVHYADILSFDWQPLWF
jgi:tRNA U38,U39,U40 pseudouridine synthase TruA